MDKQDSIMVEIAYARSDDQVILSINVKSGTTLEIAIKQSNILQLFPEIDLSKNKVGIFGKIRKFDSALRDGDRVEIYRALIADPREIRKKRAAEGKKMKKGGR